MVIAGILFAVLAVVVSVSVLLLVAAGERRRRHEADRVMEALHDAQLPFDPPPTQPR